MVRFPERSLSLSKGLSKGRIRDGARKKGPSGPFLEVMGLEPMTSRV